MSAEYYVRPFRPKLAPEDLFVTATGIYLVTRDKAMPEENAALQPFGRKKGYVCIRMAGEESTKVSAWSSTMWEEHGNYRILEKDEGLVVTQGKVPDWKGDCDFFRKIRKSPAAGRKQFGIDKSFEPDAPLKDIPFHTDLDWFF